MIEFEEIADRPGKVIVDLEDLQDLLDAREASAIAARIDAGEMTIPADVVDKLLDGVHPVKAWRTHRGVRQQDLAAEIGLTQPAITRIEKGEDASLKTLKAISEALNVDIDLLID